MVAKPPELFRRLFLSQTKLRSTQNNQQKTTIHPDNRANQFRIKINILNYISKGLKDGLRRNANLSANSSKRAWIYNFKTPKQTRKTKQSHVMKTVSQLFYQNPASIIFCLFVYSNLKTASGQILPSKIRNTEKKIFSPRNQAYYCEIYS